MQRLRTSLARRLRSLMDAHPTLNTQVKVSRRAGVSQSTIQRVLNEEASATLDVVESLGESFGMRPPSLILLGESDAELLSTWSQLNDEDKSQVVQLARTLAQKTRGRDELEVSVVFERS